MSGHAVYRGGLTDAAPEWQPLIDVVGPRLVEWFMLMYAVQLDGGPELLAYKHVATRRYLHIAPGGRVFAYVGGSRYREVPPAPALREVFESWLGLMPQPDDVAGARADVEHAIGRASD